MAQDLEFKGTYSDENIQHIQQVSLLYELALSIGTTLELNENCDKFLKVLLTRKKFNYAAVWIKGFKINQEIGQQYLVYAHPSQKVAVVQQAIEDNENSLLKRIEIAEGIYGITYESPDFSAYVQEQDIKKGCYIIYRLKDFGYLKLYTTQGILPKYEELVQLQNIIEKFANSLEACFLHLQLIEETKQRQHTEKELAKSESLHRLVVANIYEGIIITDTKGIIKYVNPRVCQMSGYAVEEMIGKSSSDLLVAEEDKIIYAQKLKNRTENISEQYEQRMKRKDGTFLMGLVNAAPYTDDKGEIIGTIGTIVDITKQKENEEEIKKSRDLYEDLFENMHDALLILDENAVIQKCNKAAKQMLDITDDNIHIDVKNIVHPEDRGKSAANFQKLLENGFYSGYEGRILSKSGEVKYLEINSNAILDEKGNFIGSRDIARDVSERKKAQASLEAREKRLQAIFDNESIGIVISDMLGDYILFNPTMEKMLGYEPGEIKKMNWLDVIQEDDVILQYTAFMESFQSGSATFVIEPRYKRKDGSLVWCRSNASLVFKEDGMIDYCVTLVEDISKRKEAEMSLKQREKHLRAIFENPNIGIIISTVQGGFIMLNETIERMIGYEPNELQNSNWIDILHEDDLPQLMESFYTSIHQKHEGFSIETRYKCKDGSIIWGRGNVATVYKEDNEIDYIVALVEDITARVKASEQLQDSEFRFRQTIDAALDGIINIDAEGNIIEINKEAEAIFGCTAAEALGKNMIDRMFSEKDAQFFRQNIKHYFETKTSELVNTRVEMTGIHKNNTRFPIEVSVTQLQYKGDNYFSVFIRDISLRKQEEQRREVLMQELEWTNQELKEFAYVVSHDLKAPLRAIGSISHWIAEDYAQQIGEEGKHQIELLQNRVNRMHNFIEGILQYSRIGRIKEIKQRVDINEVLKNVIDSLSPPPHFTITIQENMPHIVCEKIRIEQVFQNLLSNAIKYNDKQEGKIHIAWEDQKTHYMFSVTDNGPGISEKYFDKIFQIFQTLQSKDDYESTGIGLTIVKKIVEVHEGKIEVSSKLKEGTCFAFTIKKY